MKGFTVLVVAGELFASAALMPSVRAAGIPDYPVKIHVSSSELEDECSSGPCMSFQVLAVTIDGKKYKIKSHISRTAVFPTGDYQARIANQRTFPTSEYEREYKIRFSNGETAKFDVIGECE